MRVAVAFAVLFALAAILAAMIITARAYRERRDRRGGTWREHITVNEYETRVTIRRVDDNGRMLDEQHVAWINAESVHYATELRSAKSVAWNRALDLNSATMPD